MGEMNEALLQSLGNGTSCRDEYNVESNLYRKVVGTVVFVIIWPFIVLDIRLLPLGRPAAALLGATLMVVFLVVPQEQVYYILGEKGNLQTLCLLVGMMLLSYYYDREGILQMIALWILGENKPFRNVLWKVCTLSAILSAIVTNDATCLVITPLLLNEHMKQKRSPKEYPPLLIGIATSSNIGSATTFFSNPQNAFIAANSNGQVSLLIFFATALPAAILGLVCSVGLLYLFYFRTVWSRHRRTLISDETTEMSNSDVVAQGNRFDATHSRSDTYNLTIMEMTTSLAKSREEVVLSYDRSIDPQSTSQIAQERSKQFGYLETYPGSRSRSTSYSRIKRYPVETVLTETPNNHQHTSSPDYGTADQCKHNDCVGSGRKSRLRAQSVDDVVRLLEGDVVHVTDPESSDTGVRPKWKKRVFCVWLMAATTILVILLAIPPPPTVSAEFNLGLVPVGLAVFTMAVDTFINQKYAFDVMMKIDWTVILMFIGLFIWLGGFENTNFPSQIFEFMRPYMDLNTIQGVLLFTAFVIIGSNVLSNVPLVILIVDQLEKFYCSQDRIVKRSCTAQLVGVLLAWISTIAGNFTLLGSVANLIVAEKAHNVSNYRLTFWEYFKFGLCSTLLVLIIGTPIVYFVGAHIHI